MRYCRACRAPLYQHTTTGCQHPHRPGEDCPCDGTTPPPPPVTRAEQYLAVMRAGLARAGLPDLPPLHITYGRFDTRLVLRLDAASLAALWSTSAALDRPPALQVVA